jgi:hypothetical protein
MHYRPVPRSANAQSLGIEKQLATLDPREACALDDAGDDPNDLLSEDALDDAIQ